LRFGSFFILEEFNNNGEWKMENSRKDSDILNSQLLYWR